jgi:peptide/nickel transport system permease protein
MGLIGIIALTILVIISLFPAFFATHIPTKMNPYDMLIAPSWEHFLGTDDVGRDVYSRIIYGARISLFVGFVAAGISTLLGTIIGVISGYYGGALGESLMRLTDLFLAIPRLPLMLVLAAILGSSIWNIIGVIGVLLWTQVARIVRSHTLSVKEIPFIERCKAIGASDLRIITFHILPNVLPLIFANSVLLVGTSIYYEVTVSFLGLGDPTHISWGMLLHDGFVSAAFIKNAYWYIVPPGLAIVVTVLSFTFVGHALDEVLNPRFRER